MQRSDSNQVAKSNHRKVQSSTTLSRKYTKRPTAGTAVAVQRSPKIQHFNDPAISPTQAKLAQQAVSEQTAEITVRTQHPIQQSVNAKMHQRLTGLRPAQKVSAEELKNQAIQKALASAENVKTDSQKSKKGHKKIKEKMHFGVGRIMLAMSCAAAAVFAIAYFVNINMPDISLQVAAMQTGIDSTYPKYIPRGYSLSSITSEKGKITMEFSNSSNGSSFVLVEERSSWDTNALVSNYVKKEFGEQYTTVREQGLTIYLNGKNAAWVNGGNVFKLRINNGELTNKQIRSIATSL